MISFNNLGNLGRLGNQMFQYASLRGIAVNRGFDCCIPYEDVFGVNDLNVKNCPDNIYTCFNLTTYVGLPNNKIVRESGYYFDQELFDTCDDNVDLYGYFQSEKYFKHIESDIREAFKFKDEVLQNCNEFLNEVSSDRDIVAIHIRRGDYLNLQSFHPTPPIEYYAEGLKKFPDIPVLIFSDDLEWCSRQKLFASDRFYISESNSAEYDLCLMSLCTHHIIANSSFSWWGAWLAQSKNVLAPKIWFGPALSENNTKDLYLDGWEIL